jgi:phage protein D
MSHHQPDYHLSVNGQDITPRVGARLIELRLRESRGEEADQLDLTLDDADGRMALPPTGATIALRLGWAGGQMVDKGTFTVDEVEHSGAPDRLQIRARSANMGKSLRQRASQSWHETTLGAVVRQIAARNGLPVRVDGELDARAVDHIDQTGESDMHFLTRLARQNDAVCTVKKGQLVFLRTGSRASASGQAFAAVHITRMSGDQHRYHSAERTAYTGARARWHDPQRGQTRSALAGTDEDVKELQDTYASESDATRAASAEMQRVQRGKATFSITLALAQPALMPQSTVTVLGFKPQIDGAAWLVKSVEHSLGEGGFTTSVELEGQGGGEPGVRAAGEGEADDQASGH